LHAHLKGSLIGIHQIEISAIDLILKRRSVRKYRSEPVSEEVKDNILEAGRQAPSAVNFQPWHFIVVDDPVLKERLASTGRFRSFVKDCSFVVVGLYRSRNPLARRWGQVDTVIALQSMVLAAQVQGVGSCWIGDLSGDVKGLLGIPGGAEVVAMVSFGIPDEEPGQKSKKDPKKIFHYNRW
jgi:nitroreductase